MQTVRVLLDADANVEDHNENGHTPLMEAASAGHVEVAKVRVHAVEGLVWERGKILIVNVCDFSPHSDHDLTDVTGARRRYKYSFERVQRVRANVSLLQRSPGDGKLSTASRSRSRA